MKNKIAKVQIVAISDLHLEETVKSLIKTQNSLDGSKAYFFTSKIEEVKKYIPKTKKINLVFIDPINNHKDYNYFIIYKLYKYIKFSHCLITQWDGFSMCNWMWNDNFLNYDYIGAPFLKRKNDRNYCRDKNGIFRSVGNGGFSLRSKKLLEAPSKLQLKDEPSFTNYHEDGFFSVLHRAKLESYGFRWPEEKIARQFSQEKARNVFDLIRPSYGCHGKLYSTISTLWVPFNFLSKIYTFVIKKLSLL